MASQSPIRASDADRETAVRLLNEHSAQGRIDLDELRDRVGVAYAAKTRDELAELVRDLPVTLTFPAAGETQPARAGAATFPRSLLPAARAASRASPLLVGLAVWLVIAAVTGGETAVPIIFLAFVVLGCAGPSRCGKSRVRGHGR